jgi:ribose transport system substrate-binding protein
MATRRRFLSVVGVAAILCVLFFGFSDNALAQKKIRIAMVMETLQNPYFITINDWAKKTAQKHGVELITMAGAETTDIGGQIKAMEDLIQMKVDLIGVAPIDSKGIIPAIEKANRAGIPVVTFTQDAEGGDVVCYINPDEEKGGRLAGEYIVEYLSGKGKVAIIEGFPGSTANRDRLSGLLPALKKAPGIKIAAQIPGNWARDQGMKVMSDILTANPDLDLVFCMNDEMALGALEAVKARQKLGKIQIVGYNGAKEAVEHVYAGNMLADVCIYTEKIGILFTEWSIKIVKGEKPPTKFINSGLGIVTNDLLSKIGPAVSDPGVKGSGFRY